MQAIPARLKAERHAPPPPERDGENAVWTDFAPSRLRVSKRLRAVRRSLTVAIWTLLCMPVQALLLLLPGSAKVAFARLYWATDCRLMGLDVRVIGALAMRDDRPTVFISNHSSWLDIAVLGGKLPACFVAKGEVAGWPLIGTIARLGRSVFVSRSRGGTLGERDSMRRRLAAGDNLILFPEGTTSDGSRVMPFRSAFLSVTELPATADGRKPLVQPVSVVYDRLCGLPTGRASRPVFAWYGDMTFGPHFWKLAQQRGLRVTVLLHAPLDPARFASRKELARAVWSTVADGAATLRQNRPARPLGAAPAGAEDSAETAPAFA